MLEILRLVALLESYSKFSTGQVNANRLFLVLPNFSSFPLTICAIVYTQYVISMNVLMVNVYLPLMNVMALMTVRMAVMKSTVVSDHACVGQ